MKTLELTINDSDLAGWNELALVEMPAIQEDFYAFGKQNKPEITDEYILEQFLIMEFGEECVVSVNEKVPTPPHAKELSHNKFAQELQQKMRIMGPIMTPNKLIPRVTDDGEPYQVYFSAETIEKIAYKAMAENKIHKVNIEHDKITPVEDAFMIETWLKDNGLLSTN